MLRYLIPLLLLLLLFTTPAMGVNELRALVAASSTGNFAVIRNPDNPGQAWDVNPGAWATYNRTDADQKIALGSAVAAGASDEWQFANLPAGLTATASYGYDVYNSSNELLATGVTEQMLAHGAPVAGVSGVTFPATVPSATETRNAVTGGAYALSTDANGRMRIVDGTGAGELDTSSGTVLLSSTRETQINDTAAYALAAATRVATALPNAAPDTALGLPTFNAVITDSAASLDAKLDDILADTADMQPKLGTFATGTAAGDFAALPTAVEIRTEIDSNSTMLAAINTATATTIPGLIPDATDLQSAAAAAIVAANLPDEDYIDDAVATAATGGGPTDQTEVPASYVINVVPQEGEAASTADSAYELIISDDSSDSAVLCSLRWFKVIGNPPARLHSIVSITQLTGEVSGVTATAVGVDHDQAKFTLTPTVAGTYTFLMKIRVYGSNSLLNAKFTVTVTDLSE